MFWGGYVKTLEDIYRYKICNKDYIIIEQIEDIFRCNKLYGNEYLTYDYLQGKLKLDNDYLDRLLCIMQIQLGMIGRYDFINKPVSYTLLPEIYYESKWSKIYESFDADTSLKKALLISDTHIGNDYIYNQKMINNLYEYAYKHNIDCVLHLGDLFEGINDNITCNYNEEFNRQLELFERYYPNNIMTYCIKGNHDEFSEYVLNNNNLDLRVLNYLNKNFYMFPGRSAFHRYSHQVLDINDFKIHMAHEAYASIDRLNTYNTDKSIDSILDFDKLDGYLNRTYNLLLSGHRHQAMAANYTNSDCPINNLYLTVPSTSNLNINHCCALLITFNYDKDIVHDIDVKSLYSNDNIDIIDHDTFNYDYSVKPKKLKKRL